MGRQKKGDFVFTEEAILQKLRFGYMSNPRYAVANLHVFDWESDFLVKTKAGYWYEVEVKISRDDLRNDRRHKAEKYDVLEGRREGLRPNYWNYAKLRFDTGRIDAEARIKQLKGYISFLKAEYQAATGYPIKEIF